jgi:hypothetical protein
MGAEYTCIVTKENITVRVKTPHFLKNEVLTIPIDCDGEAAKNFTEHFKNGKLENLEEFEKDKNHPQVILDLLENIGLINKKYLIHYEADWAGMPCEGYRAAFDNGNVVKDTIWEFGLDGTLISAFDYLGIKYGKDVYFSDRYEFARDEYLKATDETH